MKHWVRCRVKAYKELCSTFTVPFALSPCSAVFLLGPDLLKVSMQAVVILGSTHEQHMFVMCVFFS